MGTGEPKDDTWISSEPPTSLVERNGLLRKKKKKRKKEEDVNIWKCGRDLGDNYGFVTLCGATVSARARVMKLQRGLKWQMYAGAKNKNTILLISNQRMD